MIVVWFKRDLRITDHEPLAKALATGNRVLFIYSFEPLWTKDGHYSSRHINFIKEALHDLQNQLKPLGTKILIIEKDIIPVFEKLHQKVPITAIYSHQETGLAITYNRDKKVAVWCDEQNIQWKEYISNGVFRGINNRNQWKGKWLSFMDHGQWTPDWNKANFFTCQEIDTYFKPHFHEVGLITSRKIAFQKGGPTQAWKYLDTFIGQRIQGYNDHYSKPASSRFYSSRLSPYLAWGNLSTRQVWQHLALSKKEIKDKRNLSAFLSRIRWQAHFIQKFETEVQMQFQSINREYHQLKKEVRLDWQQAWKEGRTGIPMVDAAMRCLIETGFINFRLRALLASFFTHLMWQPWQDCAQHLARCFLDFEPGIHYPQLNMQSGETGIHVIRIYNPIKNGKDHDPEGRFVKKWVPELAQIPKTYIHEPWKIPVMERQFLSFELGKAYPKPILDVKKMWIYASKILWKLKNEHKVQEEGNRILKRHTIPGRPVWDNVP